MSDDPGSHGTHAAEPQQLAVIDGKSVSCEGAKAVAKVKSKMVDQRTFCSLLKLGLDVPETFIGQFRRLDWRHEQTAQQTSARGQDRMGQSISAEVNGVADLATEIVLEMPVYEVGNLAYSYKIACHIEIDAIQQKLGLVSKPDAIKMAIDQAQTDIHNELDRALNDEATKIPVFYGTP